MGGIRVSDNANFGMINNGLHRSKARLDQLQMEAASTRKLLKPSDDPVGSARVLEIRTDTTLNDQFIKNAQEAVNYLNQSDHAVNDLIDIALRAKEIAINQSSGASSTDSTRLGISEEVAQLYEQAVNVGNRKIGNRYVFSGYKVDRPAVSPDGKYNGDDGQIMVEIAKDVFISMNVPGVEIFNTKPLKSADGQQAYEQNPQRLPSAELQDEHHGGINLNLFNELQNLRISLLTGNLEGIRGTLDNFDQLHAKLVATRARIGSRVTGVQNTQRSMEKTSITNAELSSKIEDAEMVEVMNNLAKEETVYRNALSSSQRLIQPTLLDFLR